MYLAFILTKNIKKNFIREKINSLLLMFTSQEKKVIMIKILIIIEINYK